MSHLVTEAFDLVSRVRGAHPCILTGDEVENSLDVAVVERGGQGATELTSSGGIGQFWSDHLGFERAHDGSIGLG